MADGPVFPGAVVGVERTPRAGERFALLHVCLASNPADKPAQTLCDYRAVSLRFEYYRWAGDLDCFWYCIRSLVVAGSSIVWVPSRGRNVAWTPPSGLSAPMCRELDARADGAANSAAKRWKAEFAKMQKLHTEAVAWSTHAFHLQLNRTMRFWRAMLEWRVKLHCGDVMLRLGCCLWSGHIKDFGIASFSSFEYLFS